MNEEIERILEGLKEDYDGIGISYYPEDVLEPKDPKILYDYIIELQQENKELHNKIDKAIEFVKEELDGNNELCLFEDEVDNLLKILKGNGETNGL